MAAIGPWWWNSFAVPGNKYTSVTENRMLYSLNGGAVTPFDSDWSFDGNDPPDYIDASYFTGNAPPLNGIIVLWWGNQRVTTGTVYISEPKKIIGGVEKPIGG